MSGETIGKNAAWLMAATTINKLIAFLTFYAVARLTGPTITGTFFFSISVTSIFVILADLGMTPVVIRAISGNRDDGSRLLSAALRLKALLIPVAIVASLAYAVFTPRSSATIVATVAVACFVLSADSIHLVLYGALRGKRNLKPEALGMLVGQIFTASGSLGAVFLGFGSIGLAFALFLGSAWNVLWALRQMRIFSIPIAMPTTRVDYRRLILESVPFGIAGISVKLYSYVDSLFLHAFHGPIAVGMYAVAYKLTYALQFLPITFTAALYPALAELWSRHEREKLHATFLGSMRLLAAIGFPATAGLSALADPLLPLVAGEAYRAAIPTFRILPWVLLPIFMDFPVGALLNATHRAHLKTVAMVATMFLNIALNMFLVPIYGSVGAAWAGVTTFWMLLCIGLYFTRTDAGGWKPLVSIVLRAICGAVVSWVAWNELVRMLPPFIAAVLGAVVAACVAFAVRLVTRHDIRQLLGRMRRGGPEDPVHADA